MRSHLKHLLVAAGLLGPAALAPATGIFPVASPASVQTEGTYDIDIVHPGADSFAAFQGRAVLVEFFAHW